MKWETSLLLSWIAVAGLLLPVRFGYGASAPSPTGAAEPSPGVKLELLSTATKTEIDRAAEEALKKNGLPSASIAIVKDGRLAYIKAYGVANLEKHESAAPQMRYSIGSISKQFTACAILLLAEKGQLSLDDPVGRWLADLTRAGDVTVRQVLSMTSGYQDFWPEDYVMPTMLKSTSPQQILDRWARKPLDFEPGTRWQYSNTNYVIAGLIVERVAGMPLFQFLQQHIFGPLEMKSVFNSDAAPLPPQDAERYLRYGLGPPRPAPKEGKGWMFAAGELAMAAADLAKWDISMIDQTVLQPESYRAMEKTVLLRNGASTQYGLGVAVSLVDGRRRISHNGEVSGFTADNAVYPDERTAVVVLTNLDANRASINLADKIAGLLFTPAGGEAPLAEAKTVLADLQKGKIDRSRFTSNANAYFSEQALHDLAASLGSLGGLQKFVETAEGQRGGMTLRRYEVKFPSQNLTVSTYTMPDGKLEQYIVAPQE